MDTNNIQPTASELIYGEEVYRIVGAAMDVYNELGNGFLESVYQEAIEIECSNKNIPFVSQQKVQISYKKAILKKEFIADLICFEKIVVELKALERLSGKEESQIINFLKATGYKVGLLINFGSHRKLEWKRYVY